jgi:hypothetical protein
MSNELAYMDDHFGLVDAKNDRAYEIDDFGNAVEVPWSVQSYYWQDA